MHIQIFAAKKCSFPEISIALKDPHITDIDDDLEDPQLCSLYAADIYNNLRVSEVCVINVMPLYAAVLCSPIGMLGAKKLSSE